MILKKQFMQQSEVDNNPVGMQRAVVKEQSNQSSSENHMKEHIVCSQKEKHSLTTMLNELLGVREAIVQRETQPRDSAIATTTTQFLEVNCYCSK